MDSKLELNKPLKIVKEKPFLYSLSVMVVLKYILTVSYFYISSVLRYFIILNIYISLISIQEDDIFCFLLPAVIRQAKALFGNVQILSDTESEIKMTIDLIGQRRELYIHVIFL